MRAMPRYVWSNYIIGTGRSIRDPVRPLLFDIIKNTPKCAVYSKLIDEAIIVLPDQIDPSDLNSINNRIKTEPTRHAWKTRDEVNAWLQQKIGRRVDDLERGLEGTPFRPTQEAIGTLVAFRNLGLREMIDVRGFRFQCWIEVV